MDYNHNSNNKDGYTTPPQYPHSYNTNAYTPPAHHPTAYHAGGYAPPVHRPQGEYHSVYVTRPTDYNHAINKVAKYSFIAILAYCCCALLILSIPLIIFIIAVSSMRNSHLGF